MAYAMSYMMDQNCASHEGKQNMEGHNDGKIFYILKSISIA